MHFMCYMYYVCVHICMYVCMHVHVCVYIKLIVYFQLFPLEKGREIK